MDRDRWPDSIAEFADEVTCPKCGAERRRVIVTVGYQAPVWNIVSNCSSCRFVHLWQFFGKLEPKAKVAAPESTPEPIPLPEWVKSMR